MWMDYRTILQEENDAVRERLDLSVERVGSHGRRRVAGSLIWIFLQRQPDFWKR